ncbi:MAG: hypothetical protein V9H26_05385 [Verrucomicrobiota bacterium]
MLNAQMLPVPRGPRVKGWKWALILPACLLGATFPQPAQAGANYLKNPGFEEVSPADAHPPNWVSRSEAGTFGTVIDQESHTGGQCIAIPAHTSLEQRVAGVEAGAYVARCWIKSPIEQAVTLLLQNPDRPWAAYTCTEVQVPSNQWVTIESFCPLDRAGTLSFALGGTSKDFRFYHGTAGEMGASILADDCELIRYVTKTPPPVAMWDAKKELGAAIDWSAKSQWSPVETQAHAFAGTPLFQSHRLAGAVRQADGGLMLYSVQNRNFQPRGVILPSPAFRAGHCSVVRTNERTGLRVTSEHGERAYTAWVSPEGVVSIESHQVAQFRLQDCQLRYGLLPSFVGTDFCYAPQKLPNLEQISIPSTQWFVGLVDGNDSMLVAVWDNDAQAVSLGLSGIGENRMINSFSIATDRVGFSLSFVDHPRLWHREPLKEDWLGEYVPIGWERPFPARWMGQFFVTSGRQASFREPYLDYSFPIANTKTRLWGVWFEDWNHHPFYFDGPRTVFHFEKTFIPNGDALVYFLEPAAVDLYSPAQIVEQVLGKERAAAIFDFDGNGIRKLQYSTPNEFMYDRPVCATTTRLSKIKQDEKATVGLNLATHIYEFIREIRGRIDQYAAFFEQMQSYLDAQVKAHPEWRPDLAELQAMVTEAQAKTRDLYATPLPVVEEKIAAAKRLLTAGKGDGFDCDRLDVRSPAGAQDDLCRRYNRLVMRLAQTAALKCGASPEQAALAKHVWDESRKVLRQPTRWEPRRTLYFFEP